MVAIAILGERVGTSIPEITGIHKEPAKILKAVDISDLCPDLDLDTRVVLSYVRDAESHLMVHMAIETPNGSDAKWWAMHQFRPHMSKKINGDVPFERLRGFKKFAERATLKRVHLASIILAQAPCAKKTK